MLWEAREAVVKLFNYYYLIESEAKTIHEKGIPSMLARVAKVSNHSNLKILSPKQMLQRLPIALAQLKTGNTSESLLNENRKWYILCIVERKLLKKYRTI